MAPRRWSREIDLGTAEAGASLHLDCSVYPLLTVSIDARVPKFRCLVTSVVLAMAGAAPGQEPQQPASCCALGTAPLPPLPANASEKEIWLRRIHDDVEKDEQNIFLSKHCLDDLRQQLSRVRDDAPFLERFGPRWSLAQATVRVGELAETIQLLEECEALVEANMAEHGALLPEVLFRLAAAHFRDAEKKNCIAHHNVDSCIMPLSPRAVHTQKEGADAARAILERLLAMPKSELRLEATWLLNIAHMALGTWPLAVPAARRIPMARFAAEAPMGHFVDVGRELGLARAGHAGSVVIDDFTGDGRLDVLTAKFDTGQALRLCRNDGNGHFTDVSEQAGLGLQLGGVNLVQADVDGDGMLDVLVLRGGGFSPAVEFPNSLLRQDAPGHFVDVTKAAGIEIAAPTRTAAFADVDRDGDLDLFIGYESEVHFPGGENDPAGRERYPSRLFLNDGTGKFRDATDAAGIHNPHRCIGAVFGDVDGDGYPDLFVSNVRAPNRLFMNRGDGTFADEAHTRGVVTPRASGPAALLDFDNDGDLDLFVTYSPHMWQIRSTAACYIDGRVEGETQQLYENDGTGFFRDVTEARGLRRAIMATGLNFGDVDNDGLPDLYIGTGAHDLAALFPNVLLLNGDRFRDVTVAAGVGHLQKCYGVAFGDLDDDGDLDLALSVGGFYPDDSFGDVLFRNPGNANHWLAVDLTGVTDNRFGIGACIRARITGPLGERDVYRTVGSGASSGGNPLRAHLGLGDAQRILFLEIMWPRSGKMQRIEGVPLDAAIRVVQERKGFEQLDRRPVHLGN